MQLFYFSLRYLRGKEKDLFFILLIFVAGASTVYYNNRKIWFDIHPIVSITNDDPVTSYCSRKADGRGLNQNVISYSLYGNFSDPRHHNRYAGPINYILTNISQVYPGTFIEAT